MSDGRSAKASEEAHQAVANRVVVAKEEPGFQLYFLCDDPLIEVSPTNLVFVPLLPPLVPPRLPPLHGLNTWDQKLRTLLTILEDVEDLVGKVYDTSEIILEDVEHLVGKVLSASSKSSPPGC